MKWGVGARNCRRVIVERRPGKRVLARCDCGSKDTEISLSSFIQSPRCPECCKDTFLTSASAQAPIDTTRRQLPVVVINAETVSSLKEEQGNCCRVCFIENATEALALVRPDGNLDLVCSTCRRLVSHSSGLLGSAKGYREGLGE
jgi:hypothetical protein